ncbi:MAG: SGNH/GDSL hydrolase family protein [Planctomycetaceae bacterium]|jgi:lysophospholipase L1-like esterase|nr:SGNH/GDSL hydrolase family protein [Planctomycetaceae bacterium]
MKTLLLMLVFVLTVFGGFLSAEEKPNPWAFEPNPDLPNVLILGDSISEGYTLPVRKLLHGKANVYRPMNAKNTAPENCGNTKMGLRHLDRWIDTKQIGGKKWDVIHFNWGLWDINRRIPHNQDNTGIRDKINGTISFTEKEYAENLEKIVEKLKTTGAKLIWGNTSFVPEGEEGRVLGDEIKYNAVAAEVMKNHHIPIDDIHGLTSRFEPSFFRAPGDVHYKNTGSQKIAELVTEQIKKALTEKSP